MASGTDETLALIDGHPPATPDDLFRRLEELEIPFVNHTHAPVFTVEEARAMRGNLPGCHTKNLFVRDKKERMWLFVCEQDSAVRLREVEALVGSKRLSFGSPKRLMQYLGVIPGAVNPFAIMNDHTHGVQVVLDRTILEHEPLNFHPLDNSMTTTVSADDLVKFLRAEGHAPEVTDLGAFEHEV